MFCFCCRALQLFACSWFIYIHLNLKCFLLPCELVLFELTWCEEAYGFSDVWTLKLQDREGQRNMIWKSGKKFNAEMFASRWNRVGVHIFVMPDLVYNPVQRCVEQNQMSGIFLLVRLIEWLNDDAIHILLSNFILLNTAYSQSIHGRHFSDKFDDFFFSKTFPIFVIFMKMWLIKRLAATLILGVRCHCFCN